MNHYFVYLPIKAKHYYCPETGSCYRAHASPQITGMGHHTQLFSVFIRNDLLFQRKLWACAVSSHPVQEGELPALESTVTHRALARESAQHHLCAVAQPWPQCECERRGRQCGWGQVHSCVGQPGWFLSSSQDYGFYSHGSLPVWKKKRQAAFCFKRITATW